MALAGVTGFEPVNAGVKVLCLTTWLYPKMVEEDRFELPNPMGTELQSAAFSLFAIPP